MNEHWPLAQQRLIDWWAGKGCALWVTAPADEPWLEVERPAIPDDMTARWTDPGCRVQASLYGLSRTYFGGAAFPYLDTMIGPGSLGLFLGSEPGFDANTVWYKPCIHDPESAPPIRFDPENRWWKVHLALIDEALHASEAHGGIPVGMPDLIENWDTLAQLRDPMDLLVDSMDRPEWVLAQIDAINEAFFEAFDRIYCLIKTPSPLSDPANSDWRLANRDRRSNLASPRPSTPDPQPSSGLRSSTFDLRPPSIPHTPNPEPLVVGNVFAAFSLWGPGKTAKVQCDAASMLSPEHFKKFVRPALTRQCEWLDYAMFHLDGTTCFPVLEPLLEIEPLKAVEFTPQPSLPHGGSPEWYGLYRQIKAAGKGVQAIWVKPDEVLPLLDAVGHEGMYVMVDCATEAEARELEERVYGLVAAGSHPESGPSGPTRSVTRC